MLPTAKVAVTVDRELLREVDRWVAAGEFPNRSQAVQAALRCMQQTRFQRGRLLHELARLGQREERALAEEFLAAEEAWPES